MPARLLGSVVAGRYARMSRSSDGYPQTLDNVIGGITDVKSFTAEKQEHKGGSTYAIPGVGVYNDIWMMSVDGSGLRQIARLASAISSSTRST